MPVMTAATPRQFTLASNHEAAAAARLEDLLSREL